MKTFSAVVIFYAVNLAYFYLWLLPSIGFRISAKCGNIWSCSRHLKQTWLHYPIDTSDGQWRDFRGSMWLLWACLTISAATYFCIRRLFTRDSGAFFTKSQRAIVHTLSRLTFGAVFLLAQHGYHSLIVILLAIVSFVIAKLLQRSKFSVPAVWIYATFILLFKESYRIKHYPSLFFLKPIFDRSYGGLYSWQLPANFLILRLISFSLDYKTACIRDNSTKSGKNNTVRLMNADSMQQSNDATAAVTIIPTASHLGIPVHAHALSELELVSNCLQLPDYSFLNFSVYVLYAPLYMAGPIITFDDFMRSSLGKYSKEERDSTGDEEKDNDHEENQELSVPWMYGCRWLLCFLLMETLSSFFPLFAVLNSGLFFNLNVAEMAAAAYLTLKLMWLKFLLLWRFFRLWALCDGIAAPENMLRCVSNNYSLEQFWKGWHASFNKWIVTYLYLPLGGRNNRILSVWAVFFFVAVWHDIELKLLLWGALNSAFYIIEVLAKRVSRTKQMQNLSPALLHLIQSVSGAFYIMVLIAVNLLGYAVGVEGLSSIGQKLMTSDGLKVLAVAFYFLTVGTSLMIFLEHMSCPLSKMNCNYKVHTTKFKFE